MQWVCFHYWSLHYGEAVRTHPSTVRADCRGKFGQVALTSSTSVQFVFVCYQLPSVLGSGNKRHALINMYFIHSCHFGSREHLCLPLSRVATGSHDSLPPAHPAKLCRCWVWGLWVLVLRRWSSFLTLREALPSVPSLPRRSAHTHRLSVQTVGGSLGKLPLLPLLVFSSCSFVINYRVCLVVGTNGTH